MRVFVFVNRVQEIGPRQTTALLIAALHRQGHEVWLADVDGISLVGSNVAQQIQLQADVIKLHIAEPFDSAAVASFAESINSSSFSELAITTDDLILIRTNPGRDLDNSGKHGLFLELCKIAKSFGIRVVNDPTNLAFFASKTAVALLPQQFRPEMLVTHKFDEAVAFIKDMNRECVIKPVLGSRGNNVIRISEATDGLQHEMAARFGDQSIVIQRFIDCDEPGDKRVVVLGGKLIEHNGHLAGIHRIPAAGDFRANLHAGGQAQPLTLSDAQRDAALTAASILYHNGIQLAGIDLIGTKVIEFNVFSTGGLFDANSFANFDFAENIISSLVVSV
jgi:glutathione synthase